MTEEEPFLKRWSRRKVEARDGNRQDTRQETDKPESAPGADPGAADAAPGARPAADPAHARDTPELTEADFADVDFETLDAKSDYTRFLGPGVPAAIKRKALHKLWASDTVFSQVEPFQEYAGDFTDAAVAVPAGSLKTAYRVGKGFLTDEEIAEWEKLGHPEEPKVAAAASSPPANASAAAAAAAAAGSDPEIAIAAEPADQPEVHTLLRQSDAYFASLYPAESNHLVDVATLSTPDARFFVARCGGAAVGCGALILGPDGEAELKRMFVAPELRGRRIGSRILDALEAAAKADAVRVIRLETGVRQPESIALYRRHGFTERGPFGSYQRDPLSRYFEKWIG
jgi:putative acetyltransferase